MGNQQENQYKKTQNPSGTEAKGSDFQKQGADQNKKAWPADKADKDESDNPDKDRE